MLLDRSKAPEFIIPADFELSAPQVRTLSGKRNLYFIPTPNLDAVKLEVLGKSQRLALPLEKALVPSFTLQMLTEGTLELSESDLSEFFDFHATEVNPIVTYSHEGMSLLTTKNHLFEVLPVFTSLFDQATFPEERLEKRKSQRKLSIRMEREKSASRASGLFRQALFGNHHPFGHEISESHVDQTEQMDLIHYYQNQLWTETEFFLCGNLTQSDLELIEVMLERIPFHSNHQSTSLPEIFPNPKI